MVMALLMMPLVIDIPAFSQSKKTAQAKSRRTNNNKPANTNKKAAPAVKKSSESSAEVQKKQEETQREIKQTEAQIKENEKSVKTGLKQLGLIEGDISESKNKVAVLTNQISGLNDKISLLEKSIATDQKELERLRSEYLKAVKKIRVSKKTNSELAFIFSSKNFNQALRRMRYMKEFSEWKDRQSDAIASKISSLQAQKAGLAKTKEQQSLALNMQKNEQKKLEEQYDKQDALVADLKKNGDALRSHLSRKQAEANDLKNKISALIAEEKRKAAEEERRRQEAQRKAEQERLAREEAERKRAEEEARLAQAKKEKEEAEKAKVVAAANENNNNKKEEAVLASNERSKNKETKEKKETASDNSGAYADARKRTRRSGTTTENTAPAKETPAVKDKTSSGSSSFSDMKGKLPRPASGSFKVTSRFGQQSLPDLPDVVYDNPGIDAEVSSNASALAVYGGKVSGVYMLPGYNTVVIVNHGNYYTVYGNIASASVKVGDNVNAGTALGVVAADEDDPGHGSIHFEVWKNREKLNPLEWIRN